MRRVVLSLVCTLSILGYLGATEATVETRRTVVDGTTKTTRTYRGTDGQNEIKSTCATKGETYEC